MHPTDFDRLRTAMSRRYFFGKTATGLGAAALASCLNDKLFAETLGLPNPLASSGVLPQLHHAPRAKRVIWLFMADGPSQLDLWDYKPTLEDWFDKDLPESVRKGQRITTMTSGQSALPVAASKFAFHQRGESGLWLSEAIPHLGGVADDLCVIRSMHTEAINHDPGMTMMQTGSQQPGRPSFGAWLSYGLGSENANLPGFVVLVSFGSSKRPAQPLRQNLWGASFLPSEHQGVSMRPAGDPVLYLNNPPGVDDAARRRMLDTVATLNQSQYQAFADPEINARVAQYEMAYRMQMSVPELTDIAGEPKSVLICEGRERRETYAPTACSRGARPSAAFAPFNSTTAAGISTATCPAPGQPSAPIPTSPRGLIKDLKQRGLLEDTLIVWAASSGAPPTAGRPHARQLRRDHN